MNKKSDIDMQRKYDIPKIKKELNYSPVVDYQEALAQIKGVSLKNLVDDSS